MRAARLPARRAVQAQDRRAIRRIQPRDRPRPTRARRHLRGRLHRRARSRRAGRGRGRRLLGRLAVADIRRERARSAAARLLRHAPPGTPSADALPAPLRRDRRVRRAHHLLDDGGRAAADARPRPRRVVPRLRSGEHRGRFRGGRAGHEPHPARAGGGVMLVWVGVALLGGTGAVARFALDSAVAERTGDAFPWGTLAVNLSGAFLLGLLNGLGVAGDALLLTGTGLLGSYTTFSTWMLESHRLGEDGEPGRMWLNLGVSVVAGLAAAALGRALGGGL